MLLLLLLLIRILTFDIVLLILYFLNKYFKNKGVAAICWCYLGSVAMETFGNPISTFPHPAFGQSIQTPCKWGLRKPNCLFSTPPISVLY